MRRIACLTLAVLLAGPIAGVSAQVQPPAVTATAPDAAPWQSAFAKRPSEYEVTKRSLYIPMADGVRLAADVFLPKRPVATDKLPTILLQTRYYRSAVSKADPNSCAVGHPVARYFASRGYAVVFLDVRGTGASFGTRTGELSPDEQRDGGAVLDWIVRQPWSSGKVGAWGQSYLGNAAELLLLQKRPALKAVAIVSSTFDPYADLYFPGGILNRTFREKWSALNRALDSGQPKSELFPDFVAPCSVDGDTDGSLRAAAIAEHKSNFDSGAATGSVEYRDDPAFTRGFPMPYATQKEGEPTQTPFLSIVSTMDSGYARSGIHRQINSRSRQKRLILGAGNHGLGFFYAPGVTSPVRSSFDHYAESIAFFDRFVAGKDNGYDRQPRVRWFTTGSDTWEAADAWPSRTRPVSFCLDNGRTLATFCSRSGRDTFDPVNADAATGDHTRWHTTIQISPVFYAERSAADKSLLTYTGEALNAPMTITGSPILTLKLTNSAPDADVFVYLEEVDEQGRSYIVTEGQLRTSKSGGRVPYTVNAPQPSGLRRDRVVGTAGRPLALEIALNPISHTFAKGSRVRIAVAGSDEANFDSRTLAGQRWDVRIGRGGSSLTLPVASQSGR